ncbi:MAG TPA: hypothetical protein VD993_07145 [Chitinophagaceae bacterium]|nr:hypothetical protein [Chitinophagaceae bacterium]
MKWIINIAVFAGACLICMAYYEGDFDTKKNYGGREKDLVETFYVDLVDKSPELRQLEKDLQANFRNAYEMESRFNVYNRPSAEYYNAAGHRANLIRDTALKAKTRAWIDVSRSQYNQRIAALSSLLRTLQERKVSAEDYNQALKIAMTLLMIEKHQQQGMPNAAEYQQAINDLNTSIQKMQDMIRK